MSEKIEIRSVEKARQIRNEMAEVLKGLGELIFRIKALAV